MLPNGNDSIRYDRCPGVPIYKKKEILRRTYEKHRIKPDVG